MPRQAVQCERLLQEGHAWWRLALIHRRRRVPGHEDRAKVGSRLPGLLQELDPGDPGQDDVAQQNSELCSALIDPLQGLLPYRNGHHGVAALSECPDDHLPNQLLILRDQDDLVAAARLGRGDFFDHRGRPGLRPGEVQLERRALSQFRVDPDVAT